MADSQKTGPAQLWPGFDRRTFFANAAAGLTAGLTVALLPRRARAERFLRIGDQKGGMRSLFAASHITPVGNDEVRWSLFPGAPMLVQALTAGAVDVGVIGDAPLVFAQGGRSPVKAVAGLQTDGTITAVVVRRDSPVRTVLDLKGKRIATLRAQTGHYLTLASLRQVGLKDDDVAFVFIPPTAARMALQTGAVDAWASWGPYTSEAIIVDGAREIVNGGHLMSGLSYVVATEDALRRKRDAISAYLHSLHAAHQWMADHPVIYAAAWAKDVGLPETVARDVIRGMVEKVVPLTAPVIARQQQVADFMAETHLVPERLPAAEIADTGFSF